MFLELKDHKNIEEHLISSAIWVLERLKYVATDLSFLKYVRNSFLGDLAATSRRGCQAFKAGFRYIQKPLINIPETGSWRRSLLYGTPVKAPFEPFEKATEQRSSSPTHSHLPIELQAIALSDSRPAVSQQGCRAWGERCDSFLVGVKRFVAGTVTVFWDDKI